MAVDLPDNLPEAEIRERPRGMSLIWLLPLVAVLLGAWLVYKNLSEQGPLITIRFANAEGIEAGKTRVKFRDVHVGTVETVHFSDDLSQVVVAARMDKAFDGRLTESSRFWVVRPRVEGMRISGLDTLISGAYIALDLGKGGKVKVQFDGLEEPRSILSGTAGTFYKLKASALGSLSVGAPVYFRQIAVGEVVKYRLAADHGHVEIDIFIRAPHDGQVRNNTRFWNASGATLDLTAEGLKLGVESLASLLAGGVAFETPQSLDAGARAEPGTRFELFPTMAASKAAPITVTQPYLLHFDDTVRGLAVGAPVEFRGIRVGTVTDVAFEGDVGGAGLRTPVTIALEPERIPIAESANADFEFLDPQGKLARIRMTMERTVKAGLRARLQTGSLLTGQLYVDLDFIPDAKPAEVIYGDHYPELPTAPSTFQGLTQGVTRLIAKLERLPLEEIGRGLQGTLEGTSRLVNGEDVTVALANLRGASAKLDGLLANLDQRAGAMIESFTGVGNDARGLIAETGRAVGRAESTIHNMDKSLSENGPLGKELIRTLEELSAAARSIRIMSEYLERHPEALIQGKPKY